MAIQSAPTPTRAKRTPMAKPVVTPVMVAEQPSAAPALLASAVTPALITKAAEDMPAASAPTVPERPANFVRKPFGSRNQKLDNSERPGFHRHWFNDRGSRIQDALAAGYTFVMTADGRKMSRTVGVAEQGGGQAAYRMEIPLEWFNEDQKAKEDRNRAILDQIRNGVAAGVTPGQDGAYQPVNKSGTIGADIKMHGK